MKLLYFNANLSFLDSAVIGHLSRTLNAHWLLTIMTLYWHERWPNNSSAHCDRQPSNGEESFFLKKVDLKLWHEKKRQFTQKCAQDYIKGIYNNKKKIIL